MSTALTNVLQTAQTIVLTGTSLANGSARECTKVDNSANLYADAMLSVTARTFTSGTSATGKVDVYVYTSLDGTTLPDVLTGTDAAITPRSLANLKYIDSIYFTSNSQVGTLVVSSLAYYLGALGSAWGIVLINNTGAAFTATSTDYVCKYRGITPTLT